MKFKTSALTLFLSFSAAIGGAGATKPLPVPVGIVTNYEASSIGDNYASNAENVLFDGELGVVKRNGYLQDNTASFGSVSINMMSRYVSSSQTEYLAVISSGVFRYTDGSGVYTTVSSTLTPGFDYEAVNALGVLWVTCSSFSFYWAGGSTIFPSTGNFPSGRYIEFFRNRIWVAGVDGSRSTLFGSRNLDGTVWVLGGNKIDPVGLPVAQQDGDTITGIKAYGNGLVIFKRKSTWVLLGNDQSDFTIQNISPVIGCIQSRSIKEKQGSLYWLSERGIEKLTGSQITQPLFSDPIRNITNQIVGGSVYGVKTRTDTNQGDFSLGSSTYTSLTQIVGSVQIASPTVSFGTPISGTKLHLFSNSISSAPFVTLSSTVLRGVNLSYVAEQQTPSNMFPLRVVISSQDPSVGVFLATGTRPVFGGNSNGYFIPFSLPLRVATTYWVVLLSSPNAPTSLQYDINQSTGGVPTLTVLLSSGAFNSAVIDLGPTATGLSTFSSNFSVGGGSVAFSVRGSSTSTAISTEAWVSQVVNSTASIPFYRYFQWKVDFSIDSATENPSVQDVSISWFDIVGRQSVASWVFSGDDRYLLSCTTSTDASAPNDLVIVVDKFDNFTKFRNVPAASFGEAFGRKYFGTSISSGPSAGLMYYFYPSAYDNGQPLTSFFETKDFCFEDTSALGARFAVCDADKQFDKIYIRTKNNGTGEGTLSSSFMLNRDGNYFALGDVSLNESPGLIFSKVNFPAGGGGTLGKTMRLKFLNNEAGQNMNFFGATVYYDVEPVQ